MKVGITVSAIKIGLIVVAGGSGQRMGSDCPKQFLKLHNREIILHTLDVFRKMNMFGEISVVCHENYLEFCRNLIDNSFGPNNINIVKGGSTRQESVFCGLKSLSDSNFVLIHDAVRCCVDSEDVKKLCDYLVQSGSCALGVKVKDTVKISDTHGNIISTPNRENLWQIQTPQAFEYDVIYSAHEKADACKTVSTDDCALVEEQGGNIHIVEGSYENIKITTPSDMDIAGMFLKKRIE